MLQTSLLLMTSLNKTETPIFLSVVCVCFQRQSFLRLFFVLSTRAIFTVIKIWAKVYTRLLLYCIMAQVIRPDYG